MKRTSSFRRALAALPFLVALAACGGGAGGATGTAATDTDAARAAGAEANAATGLPVTVRSADGREVTVADTSRIVPLLGNIAEVVFDLGLGDRVVGRDVSTTFPEAEDLPIVTRAHDVSAESVLSLRPTVVLVDTETGPAEALDHIRNVGVPVVVFERATRVDEIGARIETIATALGVPERGRDLAARAEADIAAVQERIPDAPAPRVAFLYLRGQAGVYLIGGPGSGADSMIAAAGGVDAGSAIGLSDSFTPITSEAMVKAAPDVILMTTTGFESVGGVDGLVQMPGVAQTPAGRNRRVITIEDGLLFSFGARTPEALASMIEQLFPSASAS